MTERGTLLAKISAILGRPMPVSVDCQGLLDDLGPLQPELAGGDHRASFVAKATSERLTATVENLNDVSMVPGATARYCARCGIGAAPVIGVDPRLTGLDWGDDPPAATIEHSSLVAVSVADYAVAETGSLVFSSKPTTPTLMNFMPLHHVVAVERRRILGYLEDYWRVAGLPNGRSVNFVTGTSGTADIEGRNVRGAHGPRYLHVLVIEAAIGDP